jgi:hypothetical protein
LEPLEHAAALSFVLHLHDHEAKNRIVDILAAYWPARR